MLRAALAAVTALAVGGDLVAYGLDAFGPWSFVFPYLWLFCALELFRAHRRLGDEEAFLLGAAASFVVAGLYAKQTHSPDGLLGVEWLGTASAAFDWGMLAVAGLHVSQAWRPRRAGEIAGSLRHWFVVLFALGGAACVYAVKTIFHHYRIELGLGPAWLTADLLFAWAAWALFRRARARAELEEAPDRDPSVWWLIVFAVWLPGVQFSWRMASVLGLPEALAWGFAVAWTLALGVIARRLWVERAHADPTPVTRSRALMGALLWRALASVVIVLVLGDVEQSPRAPVAYALLADFPARLVFFWLWATSRLAV